MKVDITIALEGSTYSGSVALLDGNTVIGERILGADDGDLPRSGRGEMLMPAVAECLAEVRVKREDIARIVCGAGPGSFTSLRVAGSAAKGLAIGYEVPLFAVSSLVLTVAAETSLSPGLYLSLLNAMRDEFFAQRVSVGEDGSVRAVGKPGLISRADLEDAARRETDLRFIGPGQSRVAYPQARGVAHLLDQIVAGGPVDIATWEPDYGRLAEAQVKWEAAHGRPLVR